MEIDYCYHSHTSRCGHALGSDEEYILNAIRCGFKEYGVSDHVMWPNHPQPGIRGDINLLDDYFSSILNLKNKYQDKINIRLGFECEYTKEYEQYYRHLLEDTPVEYLILGQHCFINKDNKIEWYFGPNTCDESLLRYANDLIEGMKSGLFAYVAHPDLYVHPFKEWNPFLEKIAHMICEAAEKYNMPLEINMGKKGVYPSNGNLMYPCDEFWKVASQYKISVYVGGDFHNASQMKTEHYKYALEIINKYNFKLLTRI